MFYNTNKPTNNQSTVYNPTTPNPFAGIRIFSLALLLGTIALSSSFNLTASAMSNQQYITVCQNSWNWSWETYSWEPELCYSYDFKICSSTDDTGCTNLKTKRDLFLSKFITKSPNGDKYLNANSKYWTECQTNNLCKPF